jgi:hypothetical protein
MEVIASEMMKDEVKIGALYWWGPGLYRAEQTEGEDFAGYKVGSFNHAGRVTIHKTIRFENSRRPLPITEFRNLDINTTTLEEKICLIKSIWL